jgi:CRP-like cAMP-binding protein
MQIIKVENKAQFFNSREELPMVSSALWLIVSGVVKTYTINNEGVLKDGIYPQKLRTSPRRRTSRFGGQLLTNLGFWGAGDVIGKSLSIVEPYLLKCLTDVEAISIPKHQWKNISTAILNHARQTQKMMYIVRSSRVWLLLQWLAQKFGRAIAEGTLIDFQITHQDLADTIGTTRITVTKILNQLERDGLILRPRNKCIILL